MAKMKLQQEKEAGITKAIYPIEESNNKEENKDCSVMSDITILTMNTFRLVVGTPKNTRKNLLNKKQRKQSGQHLKHWGKQEVVMMPTPERKGKQAVTTMN